MDPKPDHGEDSYRGSGRLTGRKALVTGGDSGTGRAAAISFAREGADVAISYFRSEEPDAQEVLALIRNAGRKAIALPGDIRKEATCKKIVAKAISPGQPGELAGIYVLLADNQCGFATGQIYGSSGGAGQP